METELNNELHESPKKRLARRHFSIIRDKFEDKSNQLVKKPNTNLIKIPEIAALAKYFTSATHILCHFHVLKAVDAKLIKLKNLGKEKKHQIQQHFRAALFATTQDEFDSLCDRLLSVDVSVTTYFRDNWFNITDKWSSLGRRQLQTFGNNTTNRLER